MIKADPDVESQIGAETKKPALPEVRIMLAMTSAKGDPIDLLDKNSSHRRTCHVTAYALRFINQAFETLRVK